MHERTVVITGAGKGFGKSLALELGRAFNVIAITRSASDIDLIKTSQSADLSIEWILGDVTDPGLIKNQLEPSLKHHGSKIWGLINNAGVRCRSAFLDLSKDRIDDVIEVNLKAPIVLCQAVMPFFIANGGGRVINISSILAQSAQPDLGLYALSKAGLDGLTRSLAVEFGPSKITCNSILPGFCETSYAENFKNNSDLYSWTLERTPAHRWGTDAELNAICRFLLSDESGYINGACLPVDGGWLAN